VIPLNYNLRSLKVRRTTSILTVFGIALVTMVVVVLLSVVSGISRTLELAADPRVWIVMSRGVASEPESYIPQQQLDVLRTRPEIVVDGGSAALISPEVVTPFNAAIKRAASQFYPATLRGVRGIARRVHQNVRLIEGRWPEPGHEEMVIGRKLLAKFPELTPGATFRYGRRNWTIVGILADRGSVRESEFWTDLDVLEQDAHFENGFSSFHVVLKPEMVESFRKALIADDRITVQAVNEQDFYAEQAEVAERLRTLALFVSAVIGVGAAFGGMNSMYAAVARRAREVGVLRSLGFQRGSVLLSFLVESEMLALAGGVTGMMVALLLIVASGLNRRMLAVGPITYSSRFSLSACALGILAAVFIGALGGLLPALRAARMPVAESLREA
jgi:putative ABC transport system permease protein